jgi:hypothetical protein
LWKFSNLMVLSNSIAKIDQNILCGTRAFSIFTNLGNGSSQGDHKTRGFCHTHLDLI